MQYNGAERSEVQDSQLNQNLRDEKLKSLALQEWVSNPIIIKVAQNLANLLGLCSENRIHFVDFLPTRSFLLQKKAVTVCLLHARAFISRITFAVSQ